MGKLMNTKMRIFPLASGDPGGRRGSSNLAVIYSQTTLTSILRE